ncbi:MAG: hypothetical protein WAV05_00985 [Anaerolineales bacterium]
MKHNPTFTTLFFLLLVLALVLSAAHQAGVWEVTSTPTAWLPPKLLPDPPEPTRTPGWWDEIPTAVPFPSPTPRQ